MLHKEEGYVFGRELDLGAGEHWMLSQQGIKIMCGANVSGLHHDREKHGDRRCVYVEDPSQFRCEKDIFDFVRLEYLPPDARCA